ncbi:PRD domain-containing protein [Sinobaca sp. H24]|uniref:BglG family transcription antiterminator n=1 Tax=Sinobaca sp. H24 TaxID=2923376 RepID=UPI00207A8B75|nr:PRD domain-containing protein [Sinobaca sp. H24]
MNQPLTRKDMKLENCSFEEYRLAEDILTQAASLNPNIIFDEYEKQYVTYLLISLQLCQTSNEDYSSVELPVEVKSKINTAFETIFKQYGFHLEDDHQLFDELTGRISKSIGPLKYNFPVENPFIGHIKKEYMTAYDLAVALAKELQSTLKVHIPENEIGYLTLHIVHYLEKYQESKQKVAIVYEKNKLIGNLLERKIAQYFPNISPEGAYAVNEMEHIPSDVKTIITTIQIPKKMNNRKIIFISSEVTNEDIRIISSHLKRGLLENYLKEEDFFFLQAASQHELLKTVTYQSGLEPLLESIIEREQMSSTNIGNNVAMPHPFEAGNNLDLRVVIAVNSQKIKWGEKMAQIIFLFVPPAVNKKQSNDFFIGIHDILNDSAITNRLTEAESFDQFLKIWNNN